MRYDKLHLANQPQLAYFSHPSPSASAYLPGRHPACSPAIQENALKLQKESPGILSIVLVAIASPQLTIAFREIILRYEIPEELDRRNAIIQLIRWDHILDLFQDCGGSETRSTMDYVIITSANFVSRPRNLGNPGHTDNANVSLAILKEIFPDLRPNAEEYEKK
ncbi:hypothetical protein BDV38DRAFT_276606 [Aspergillus pseudotamarii]|uniref:Uncharacterized protein n=1 Tax=Aspergillus pseudotamarii TaxID=132259 RepID=A0A5N6TB73_ASPPS|nr:uncharacterized protein BDV38DRAFT_276606 [Aspergillus pseudotamarii]KAE8143520.1 hypothetical protein BDV38DRAFT_276606 [Aspergillus pseudotamarii]